MKILSEKLTNNLTLELHGCCLKPRLIQNGEAIKYLSISLKYYYDKSGGFVTRKERTNQECLVLARKWANTFI
ncbi:MAG: hypothetical protein GY928_23285 [Colwellia sp.]|nr:hypothetical protein [Colwellia sp.]